MRTNKHITLTILLVITLALVFTSFIKNRKLPEVANVQESSVSVTTEKGIDDPMADWDTYTNSDFGISFKYPQGFEVVERSPGFFVLSIKNEHVPQGGISIDARVQDTFQSMEAAMKSINEDYTVVNSGSVGKWTTFVVVGKEGMIKDLKFKMALAPYKSGVMVVSTIDADPYSDIFEDVLTTF